MQRARHEINGNERNDVALGMTLDLPGDEDVGGEGGEGELATGPSKAPVRKTKQQRRKAARVLEEVCPTQFFPSQPRP